MNINEGLICAQCMKIFDSIKILQDHFILCKINQSGYSREEKGVVGIFKKAKKTVEDALNSKNAELFLTGSRTQNNPFEQLDLNIQSRSYAFYEEPNIKSQAPGVTIDRSNEFLNLRRIKLQSSAIETSNLIMRIEKLLSFSSNKSSFERKNLEQTVVEWVQDDLVPMCPSCGLKFGLNLTIKTNTDNPIVLSTKDDKNLPSNKPSKLISTLSNLINFEMESSGPFIMKKHHCRLCGALICSNCSFMFPSSEANRLISAINSRLELRESQWQGSGSLTWKEDSETSLDSMKSRIKNKEYCIRCCDNCKLQIESKWIQMEQRVLEADVVVMYKELITEINKTRELISQFQKIALSLSSGESEYSYNEAKIMRSEIVNRCQNIDAIGNRFKYKHALCTSVKEATLFNAIYRNAYLFLQNNFATLKYLPSEEEFKELENRKLMKIREEVSNEIKNKNTANEQIKYATDNKLPDFGWAPSIKTNGTKVTDIENSNLFEIEQENTELSNVALQIENVRRFIDQAREAKRFKDVEILQRNMIDLELEYDTLHKKLYA